MAAKRLALLDGIPTLDIPDEAILLSKRLIHGGPLPIKAETDALHISIAAVKCNGLSGNMELQAYRHAQMQRAIQTICNDADFDPPVICTADGAVRRRNYVEG